MSESMEDLEAELDKAVTDPLSGAQIERLINGVLGQENRLLRRALLEGWQPTAWTHPPPTKYVFLRREDDTVALADKIDWYDTPELALDALLERLRKDGAHET